MVSIFPRKITLSCGDWLTIPAPGPIEVLPFCLFLAQMAFWPWQNPGPGPWRGAKQQLASTPPPKKRYQGPWCRFRKGKFIPIGVLPPPTVFSPSSHIHAGKGVSNPLATILSAAMMLRHSFHLEADQAHPRTTAQCGYLLYCTPLLSPSRFSCGGTGRLQPSPYHYFPCYYTIVSFFCAKVSRQCLFLPRFVFWFWAFRCACFLKYRKY